MQTRPVACRRTRRAVARIRAWRAPSTGREGTGPCSPQGGEDPFIAAMLATTPPAHRRQRLRLMLMRERVRGQSGSPAYSVTRHIHLKRAMERQTTGG